MRRRLLLLLPFVGGLSGCVSPPTDLYTLAAIAGAPVHTGPRSIELRRISLAGYLDRPEIVRAVAGPRLLLSGQDNWGEPFGRMLERVLIEDLTQRLPEAAVFAEAGAISTPPDIVLELDMQRLEPDGGGLVVLLAQLAIRREGSRPPVVVRTVRLTAAVAGPGTAELVGAMSAVLAQLADRLAGMLGGG